MHTVDIPDTQHNDMLNDSFNIATNDHPEAYLYGYLSTALEMCTFYSEEGDGVAWVKAAMVWNILQGRDPMHRWEDC